MYFFWATHHDRSHFCVQTISSAQQKAHGSVQPMSSSRLVQNRREIIVLLSQLMTCAKTSEREIHCTVYDKLTNLATHQNLWTYFLLHNPVLTEPGYPRHFEITVAQYKSANLSRRRRGLGKSSSNWNITKWLTLVDHCSSKSFHEEQDAQGPQWAIVALAKLAVISFENVLRVPHL